MTGSSSLKIGPVRYGFEPEDREQERQLGIVQAERWRPGDKLAGYLRAKTRMGRHRKRERRWNELKIRLQDFDAATDGLQYQHAVVHEILDLLPYMMREEALTALLDGDGRVLRRVGRQIREALPKIVNEEGA